MLIPKEEYSRIQAVLPILCVDCLIIYHARCLLLKRTQEPAKGLYWFPGGRIFKGELIPSATIRKAREEVNLECNFERIISIEETIFTQQGDMQFDVHTVNVCCQLSVSNISDILLDNSHDDYIWATPDDILMLNLHPAVSSPLLKCFNTYF
ncbi:MAG: NUDIX domain-containing protein [Desulfuromonadaceae bacterium]|nr:NUDIX domain-containing protein [Desulfuromonadaceae bacterium]